MVPPVRHAGVPGCGDRAGAAAQPRDRPALPPPARGGQGLRHARRAVGRAGGRRRGGGPRRARVRPPGGRLRRAGRLGRAVAAGVAGRARRRVPRPARRGLGPRRLGRPGAAPGAGVRSDLGRRLDAGGGPPRRPVRRRLAAPGGQATRPAGCDRPDPPPAGRGRPARGVRCRRARRLLRRRTGVGRRPVHLHGLAGRDRGRSCAVGSRPAPTSSRCGSARGTGPRWSTRSSASAPRSPRCCRADPDPVCFFAVLRAGARRTASKTGVWVSRGRRAAPGARGPPRGAAGARRARRRGRCRWRRRRAAGSSGCRPARRGRRPRR